MKTMNTYAATHNLETMNIQEAKQAVKTAVKLYLAKDPQGNYRMKVRRTRPLCMMGPAGIGKTEVVTQVAGELDLALCSYSLVHHTRQSLLGLPRLETHQINGEDVSCTRYTMSEIVDEIHQTILRTGKKEGILFLDEFNASSDSITPIMLQILQEKSIGPHPLPAGWILVLSGNPTSYNKSAKELDAVTMDRLRLMYLEPDLAAWTKYAQEANIHPVILGYLKENPDFFYRCETGKQKVLITPRGWEDLSIQLQLMEEMNEEVTPLFIGQFFQCTDMIHSFYVYYRRFASMHSNKLLERVFDRDLTAIGAIQSLSTHDRWAFVHSILTHIQTLAHDFTQDEMVTDVVYNTLKKNRNALKEGGGVAVDTLYALANDTEDPLCKQKLLSFVDAVCDANGWTDISAHFNTHMKLPLKGKCKEYGLQIDNALFLCSEAIRDAENTERLLHGVADHPEVSLFMAKCNSPAFKALQATASFDEEEAV